jgi:hypothetical protein
MHLYTAGRFTSSFITEITAYNKLFTPKPPSGPQVSTLSLVQTD